jgi:hypothetical protein
MTELLQDSRYAVRRLQRHKGFIAIANRDIGAGHSTERNGMR